MHHIPMFYLGKMELPLELNLIFWHCVAFLSRVLLHVTFANLTATTFLLHLLFGLIGSALRVVVHA
jgi:hypothetical protein